MKEIVAEREKEIVKGVGGRKRQRERAKEIVKEEDEIDSERGRKR
jgi:hypothetical protein